MRRILLLVTLALVMAAMMALSGAPAGAQTQICPEGAFVGYHPLTVEAGCLAYVYDVNSSCPEGTERVFQYTESGVPTATPVCFGPFVHTKETCKDYYAALGFKQQGECIKAAKQAGE